MLTSLHIDPAPSELIKLKQTYKSVRYQPSIHISPILKFEIARFNSILFKMAIAVLCVYSSVAI